MFKRNAARALALALSLTFAATSAVIAPPAQAAGTKYPLTVTFGGYTTKIAKKPVKIISLSPSGTEVLFGVGAGKQVFLVDSYSNYPKNAPMSDLSGYTPNVEAIAGKKPDLVLLQADSVKTKEVRNALTKLNIPVLIEPAPKNLADVYAELRMVGKVTDNSAKAEALAKKMDSSIKAIVKGAKKGKGATFFHELDDTYYTITSKTFLGGVYKDFGLVNIADAADTADSAGYPQLTAEYVLSSNPQYVFLADAQYGVKASTVAQRAGWASTAAVKNNNVIELPTDIPSRWGPRLVDFYALIAKTLAASK